MDLIDDSFKLLSLLGLGLILLLGESIEVLFVSLLLLFDAHLDRSKVLLQFSLIDTVLVLNIFKSDLGLLLKLGVLVKILEHQMLGSLLVDFDFDLMLLFEILEFSLLISKLSLFILKLFLGN